MLALHSSAHVDGFCLSVKVHDLLFCVRRSRRRRCCSGRLSDVVNRLGRAVVLWWWRFVLGCRSRNLRRRSLFGACSCTASKTWW